MAPAAQQSGNPGPEPAREQRVQERVASGAEDGQRVHEQDEFVGRMDRDVEQATGEGKIKN